MRRGVVMWAADSLDKYPLWPLGALFVAYPLWWLLGVGGVVAIIVSIPMAISLYAHRESLVVPKGFGLWLAFLAVAVLSITMLGVRAPFAAPSDGDLAGRVLTFLFRLSWYAAATVVLLHLINQGRRVQVEVTALTRIVGFIFVWSVLGGVLGLIAPDFQRLGLLAQLLPQGLVQNPFVADLVTIDVADVVSILGYEEVRPKAPFAYANLWGAVVSISSVFFVHGWLVKGRVWWRLAGTALLIPAMVVTVYSLNRTMWLALGVAAAYGLWQLVRIRPRALAWVVGLGAAASVLLVLSGLTAIVNERLANPHSDDRRSQLIETTVRSTVEGSPVLGFGGTRDLAGSFASIAGGDTPDCQGCGVPPLGTQGHLWLVLFAQGFAGVLLFLGFIFYRLAKHFGTKDPPTSFAVAAVIVFIVEMPTYDLLGVPMLLAMVALALAWQRRNQSVTLSPGVG